jgi:hypothetical protein
MIDISNVVSISVSAPAAGLAPYSINNLMCLTKDTPIVDMSATKYKVYTNSTDVGTDWGTTSKAYLAAIDVFSQSPNIKTGGGVFLVAPLLTSVVITPDVAAQEITVYTQTINGTAFEFTSDATPTVAEVVTGLKDLINAGTTGVVATGTDTLILNSSFVFTHSESAKLAAVETEETLATALARVQPLVYFGGFSYAYAASDVEITAASTVAQALRKLFFVNSSDPADLVTPGLIFTIQGANQEYTRCMFYSVAASLDTQRWGYAGRAMSTDFAGNNTTQTMHLKQITNLVADPGMTSSLLALCAAVGADAYVDIASRATLMTYGANGFYDDVYNLAWFLGALEIAGFNALATTSTKIPQTETGMDYLKSAYRKVCEQAATNRFVAPGSWTSPDTFGVLEAFLRNVSDVGYYIYSQPVNQQDPADRVLRKSPLTQIAIKFSGAIHSTSVIVNVNQ